jgi:hypothetical protein
LYIGIHPCFLENNLFLKHCRKEEKNKICR